PCSASQDSKAAADRDRMAGFRSLKANLRYGLEYVLSSDRPRTRLPLVGELLQVRAHRHLGGDHQLSRDLLPIDALGQLARGARSARQLGPHLRLPVESVRA